MCFHLSTNFIARYCSKVTRKCYSWLQTIFWSIFYIPKLIYFAVLSSRTLLPSKILMLVLCDCFLCSLHELIFVFKNAVQSWGVNHRQPYISHRKIWYFYIWVVTGDILCCVVWMPVDISVWELIFLILFSPNGGELWFYSSLEVCEKTFVALMQWWPLALGGKKLERWK